MAYQVYYSRQAAEDWGTLKRQGKPSLAARAQRLLKLISANPFAPQPPFKKLNGELSGLFARRINIQHRLVYQVIEERKAIKVVSMWTHYGD
jgi:toxin YoeB